MTVKNYLGIGDMFASFHGRGTDFCLSEELFICFAYGRIISEIYYFDFILF